MFNEEPLECKLDLLLGLISGNKSPNRNVGIWDISVIGGRMVFAFICQFSENQFYDFCSPGND